MAASRTGRSNLHTNSVAESRLRTVRINSLTLGTSFTHILTRSDLLVTPPSTPGVIVEVDNEEDGDEEIMELGVDNGVIVVDRDNDPSLNGRRRGARMTPEDPPGDESDDDNDDDDEDGDDEDQGDEDEDEDSDDGAKTSEDEDYNPDEEANIESDDDDEERPISSILKRRRWEEAENMMSSIKDHNKRGSREDTCNITRR